MKIITKLAFLSLLLVGFTACGDSTSKDLAKQLNSTYDKDGQQVELVGYISLGKSLIVKDGIINAQLDNVAGQSSGEFGKFKLQFGQGPNQIYIPEEFRMGDLEIYDNEGKKHGYMTEVKITGTVKYTDKDWKDVLDKQIEDCASIDQNAPVQGIKAMKLQSLKRNQERVTKREKETGDPNDYSFYIVAEKIEIP